MSFQFLVSLLRSDGILRAYFEEYRGVSILNLRISLQVDLKLREGNFQNPHFTASCRYRIFANRRVAGIAQT